MSHYFTNDHFKNDEREIKVIINKIHFKFITDSNTFSKKGLDFGTRSLLESLFDLKGDVLDFGCGWGPIGIYLKKAFDVDVDMCDINERALKLSCKNAKINEVNVNVFKSDIFENVEKKYDYIVTNPPVRVGKDILYKILESSMNHLKKYGKLIFVINKNQGAKSVLKNMSLNYQTEVLKKNKGFFIICCENR